MRVTRADPAQGSLVRRDRERVGRGLVNHRENDVLRERQVRRIDV
jgi:hypothetical protein